MRSNLCKIESDDGWSLACKRSWVPGLLCPDKRPVVLLPGYGNNASMFAYPDDRRSFESILAHTGREVWSVNLRGQGGSRRRSGAKTLRIEDMALMDLRAILDDIAAHTMTSHQRVDAIGASLGGSILYIHSALQREHRLGSIVAIGSPLRWEVRHPIVALALTRPDWVGWVPVKGSRFFLRTAFPLLKQLPVGLRAYIHPKTLASHSLERLLRTVDDPNRHLTRQLARWISTQDLILGGTNITQELHKSTRPLLCVIGNRDGIVPAATALSAIQASGATTKDVLRVGSRENPFGHTDPFIHRDAPALVFAPVAQWLDAQTGT